jgi:nucleolar complex protein 3
VKVIFFQQELKMGELALSCMCDLLVAHPYFNFSHNLVQLLVPYLNHPLPSVRQLCSNSVCAVFRNDKRGGISLEVRILHVRTKEFYIVAFSR